jgi:poly-gamma-glutamate synthesis protein (capsule biosynthesis protein)
VSHAGKLVHSARDVCRFPWHESVALWPLVGLMDRLPLFDYPVRSARGDLEEMRFLDKVYWVYKTGRAVPRAVRGSGLEDFFARQTAPTWEPPRGFAPVGELTVSAAGDLMSHPYLAASSACLYAEVADDIFGADVAMANLECVVTTRGGGPLQIDAKSGPQLRFDPQTFDVVSGFRDRRFAFLATACNHSLDYGEEGVSSTIGALRDRGVAFHGMNETEADAERAAVVEKNGVRIGIVAHTFGLNAYRPPLGRRRIVNRIRLNGPLDRVDFDQIDAQIRHCREEAVDFLVAQLHWGFEYEMYPRPEQVEVAHALAERGVDAIVGHHPHVLQPVEYYRTRRDPRRVVPIFYSLGNLTNPFSAAYACRSGVARLALMKGALDGATVTYVVSADVLPIDQEVHGSRLRLRRALPGGHLARPTWA